MADPAATPVPGTPEYEAAMIAKFDATLPDEQREEINRAKPADSKPEAAKASTHVKPDGVPDKFWNAETGVVDVAGLAKSYTELERSRGNPPKQEALAAPQVDPAKKALEDAVTAVKAKQGATPEEIAAAEKALADYKPPVATATPVTPEDLAAYTAEFTESGALSDASYAKLAAQGIPRETVDAYIAGQQAIAEQRAGVIYERAGGKEQYGKMVEWAKATMTAADKIAYNAAIDSGDPEKATLAFDGLKARYIAANGSDPKLVNGGRTNDGGGVKGYESRAEMTRDIKDPKYRTDEAFRKSVEKRIEATTAF